MSTLHRMRTEDGDVLVWFGSGTARLAMGERYAIKATVKSHDVRDGVAQTKVLRVKVVETKVGADGGKVA